MQCSSFCFEMLNMSDYGYVTCTEQLLWHTHLTQTLQVKLSLLCIDSFLERVSLPGTP